MTEHAGFSEAGPTPWAVAVADINWFTTESLFRELDDESSVLLALRCMDFVNGWRKGLFPWSPTCRTHHWGVRSFARDMVLPSGWMKRYPRVGMRPIGRAIRGFWRSRREDRRGLILTYPHYLHLLPGLDADRTLYYNLDDYALYWPKQADEVRELERRLVQGADATVCVSAYRAEELRQAFPRMAGRIHHLPHGTPTAFLADEPRSRPTAPPRDLASLPRPLLGYVGSIESRVDWDLMDRLADALPGASIVLVGTVPGARSGGDWRGSLDSLLSRRNVHAIGWRPQAELPSYYAAFDVNLIPYLTTHPFNVACSPTKIADGLGSGRPIVATAIPECRLYGHLFDVVEDADAFLAAVRRILARSSDDGRASLRHEHARANTCAALAARLVGLLKGHPGREIGREPHGDAAGRTVNS
ncbi:glycosyltransferase [Aquisphaera insulae]|uniref:glycosyltransferase n=1 Tax=Aquisphaera insulae TaxID=2712864 RepID=UPI0013ED0DE4|nr:glycosyltransferase [Aquisphaera insulae]